MVMKAFVKEMGKLLSLPAEQQQDPLSSPYGFNQAEKCNCAKPSYHLHGGYLRRAD
jgi:hypothetical protein